MLSADKGASGQAALLGLAYARGGRGGTEKVGAAARCGVWRGLGWGVVCVHATTTVPLASRVPSSETSHIPYSHKDACMHAHVHSYAVQAGDFASKLDQLTGMGFPLAMAAGALAKHGNDVEAATESCLAIAM